MDLISTVNGTLTIVKRLREISKNIEDAEFKNLLADLSSELADAKLEAANLKEALAALQEENRVLKSKAPAAELEPSGFQYGCYKFEGKQGLYCTACWDARRQLSATNRVDSHFRSCPVCRAKIGS